MSEQPPSPPQGWTGNLLHAAKNLTFRQVLAIGGLVILAIPAYSIYRALNDPVMLGRFLSSYEEITSDKIPCTLRIASVRGGGDTYAIWRGFSFEGADRWVVGVHMDRKPTDVELVSYCETLDKIVDYMRRPDAPPPTFPGTDEELIWRYPLAPAP